MSLSLKHILKYDIVQNCFYIYVTIPLLCKYSMCCESKSLYLILNLLLQYYEMSYGLNVEMHKQVTSTKAWEYHFGHHFVCNFI